MDFYEILQVDRKADAEVIQAAYRALARRNHPDMGGDPARMVAINEAWHILGDPARRKGYDIKLRRPAPAPTAGPSATTAASRATTPAGRASKPAPDSELPRYQPQPSKPPAPNGDRVLDWGRYAGWSVGDVSREDPDYLLWLERTMAGRSFRADIERALEMRRGPAMAMATAGPAVRPRRGRWFR